jgi:DNA-binding NtrC family response regulator
VRELRNVVQRALLLRKGSQLDADVLTFEQVPEQAPNAPGSAPPKLLEGLTLHQMEQQWERQAIEEALRVCNHHRGRAAKLLGLSRSSFFERLKA